MAFADAKELQKIPGIGIKTANNIIDYYRTSQGDNTKEGILKIKGIGPDKFEKIRPYIVIEQPLKTQCPEIELKKGLKTKKSVKKSDFLIRKDINLAGYEDLVKVKGLGPCIANRILKQRDKQGGKFRKIQDLVIVKGIGFKSMSLLRKYFFVSRKNSKPLKSDAKNFVSDITLPIVSDKILPIVSKKPLNRRVKGRAWNWKDGYARIFRAYPELNQ
jgi:competence ComEA-like helix-hairpin-helix protein